MKIGEYMLSSKIEKIIVALMWYVLLIIFRFVLPISEPPSDIDKYVVVFLSVMTTIIICRVYVYHRNKHMIKNINILLESNQLEEAISYAEHCFNKHKKSNTVYTYRLYAMAMCGRITEFDKILYECSDSKKRKKIMQMDFVKGLESIIRCLKTTNCEMVDINERFWKEIVSALSEKDHRKSIPVLLNIYNTKYSFIKTVVAFKLCLIYSELNDTNKSEHYYNEALRMAPSLEISYYIEDAYSKLND